MNGKLTLADGIPDPITTIHISDVHMGNKRVSVPSMVKGLDSMVTRDILIKAHILFIAGDFWDKILSLPGNQIPDILIYVHRLLRLCRECNCKVRVLEGTPSHDRKQSKVFITINEMLEYPCDLRYYDTLCIDREDDLDLDVLYVPDEWKHCPEKAWDDVQEALKSRGLTKVDYSIMHGMFGYQMPKNLGLKCHDEKRYISITKRYISIGHVHVFSTYDIIFAQGSACRISHNEEGDKGMVLAESPRNGGKGRLTFIKNKFTIPFESVDVSDLDEKQAAIAIDEKLQTLLNSKVTDFHLRVIMGGCSLIRAIYNKFKNEYPDVNWGEKVNKVKKLDKDKKSRVLRTRVTAITSESIDALVESQLANKGNMSSNALLKLKEVKSGIK